MGTVSFALSDLGQSNSRYFFSSKFPNYYPSPLFISAWFFLRKYRLEFQVLKSNWKRNKRFSQLSKHCIVCSLIYGFWWGSCYSIFSVVCMFCRSLFVLLSFFFWPLCCLFFLDIRILITSLWYLQTLLPSMSTKQQPKIHMDKPP